jgi:hypothetical protein
MLEIKLNFGKAIDSLKAAEILQESGMEEQARAIGLEVGKQLVKALEEPKVGQIMEVLR